MSFTQPTHPRPPGPAGPRLTGAARLLAVTLLIAAPLAAFTGLLLAAPAQAGAYRYWGYFQLSPTGWSFAPKGPDQTVPKDGSVEGWRFAVADESSTRAPRATGAFAQLCAGTGPAAGTKRVALVVDFGRPADAADGARPPRPLGTCVRVPTQATGSQVLVGAGLQLRVQKGLTCALDGWPAAGCGEAVAKVSAEAAASDAPVVIAVPSAGPSSSGAGDGATRDAGGGVPTTIWVAVLVAVLGGAGLALAAVRRGRDLRE